MSGCTFPWGGNNVSREERQTILLLGRERGVAEGSPAEAQLLKWLEVRPDDELFETSVEVIKYSLTVLPHYEQEERIKRIVDACREVAKASGSKISCEVSVAGGQLVARVGVGASLRARALGPVSRRISVRTIARATP